MERRLIESRLAEERSALEALSAGELPAALTLPMRAPVTAVPYCAGLKLK